MQQNRRRVPRRAIEISVGVLKGGEYTIERATQLGEGGMMLAPSRRFEKGQNLLLTFQVPGAPLIVVRGMVQYLHEGTTEFPHYGIQFLNLDFLYKREIRNFVASSTETSDMTAAFYKEAT